MKIHYIILLGILLFLMLRCIILTLKTKTKYSLSIIYLLISAIIATIIYILFLLSTKHKMAVLFDGLYFICTDWLLILMLNFLISYADENKHYMILQKIFIILASIDSISLLINNFENHMFTLKLTRYGSSGTYYWSNHFFTPHYVHLGFCYFITLVCFIFLIKKIITYPKLYKAKYISIFFPFMIVLLINFICYSLDLPIDYSVSLYSLLAVNICYYSLFATPKKVIFDTNNYMVQSIKSCIFYLDIQWNCIFANNEAKKLFNVNETNNYKKIEDYVKDFKESYKDKVRDLEEWENIHIINGETHYFDESFQKIKDKHDSDIAYFFTLQDKTERIKKYHEEQYKASHDSLTDSYNRESFFNEAKKILNKEPDVPRYMLASNIKDFKLLNDLFGSKTGDALLKKQGELVKLFENQYDICGRISDDKFAMILPKANFNEQIFISCIKELELLFNANNYKIHYYLGVYEITNTNESIHSMYNKANMAIDTIKGNYEWIVAYYDNSIMQKLLYEKNIISEFNNAVKENQFLMYLQPQFDCHEKLLGAEALIRWQHPTRGLLFPGSFIEIFENSGLIHKLDKFIWEEACKKLKEWELAKRDDLYISVNISTKDFYYLNLYDEFTSLVEKYEINPKNLKLEITETVLMSDLDNHIKIIKDLRKYGFDVEIDDFGSGYSSLNMLKDIYVDVLKIDMIFLRGNHNNNRNKIILSSIISMSKALGILVISEGVETKEQLLMLKEMGCDVFQGYYFEKPIPVKDFEQKYME